jgi:hypothetical protein
MFVRFLEKKKKLITVRINRIRVNMAPHKHPHLLLLSDGEVAQDTDRV